MQPYPHHYSAHATARAAGLVTVSSASLPSIETAPPPEFGGPGGIWSPETLLSAAIADCFILTFRSLARAARFDWITLDCHVESTLERIEGVPRFTHHATTARLAIAPGTDGTRARHLLEQAEHGCLVANSLSGERTLTTEVVVVPEAPHRPGNERSAPRASLSRR